MSWLDKLMLKDLKEACSNPSTQLSEVVRICKLNPQSIRETDDSQSIPIHYACQCNLSFDIINYLVQNHPKSLSIRNIRGELPIHRACIGLSSVQSLKYIIDMYPEGLLAQDSGGDCPLHICLIHHRPIEIVKTVITSCPKCLQLRNWFQILPIHYSFHYKYSCFELIQLFVDLYPDCVTALNSNRNLPLNCALIAKSDKNIVRFLIERHPEAVISLDSLGRRPLIQALRFRHSAEVIHQMMSILPDSLHASDATSALEIVESGISTANSLYYKHIYRVMLNISNTEQLPSKHSQRMREMNWKARSGIINVILKIHSRQHQNSSD